jgi:hypothetical protein
MYVWPDHFWHTPLLELGPLVQHTLSKNVWWVWGVPWMCSY